MRNEESVVFLILCSLPGEEICYMQIENDGGLQLLSSLFGH